MTSPMTRETNLSRKAQDVDSDTWYYEQKEGLLVVHRVHDAVGGFIKNDQFTIPWRKVRASLKRKDAQ